MSQEEWKFSEARAHVDWGYNIKFADFTNVKYFQQPESEDEEGDDVEDEGMFFALSPSERD